MGAFILLFETDVSFTIVDSWGAIANSLKMKTQPRIQYIRVFRQLTDLADMSDLLTVSLMLNV